MRRLFFSNIHLYIPPTNEVWGVLEPPCLSVYPSVLSPVRAKFVSCLYLSYGENWKFLFLQRLLNYELRLCYDLKPRSVGQVQGHWKEKRIIHVCSISF